MHTPYFSTLLEHSSADVLSTLQLSERKVRFRLLVTGYLEKEQRTYEMTMIQVGGVGRCSRVCMLCVHVVCRGADGAGRCAAATGCDGYTACGVIVSV